MLNISENRVNEQLDPGQWRSLNRTTSGSYHRTLSRFLLVVLLVSAAFLFLPWTQNVITRGKIITLDPMNRPQTIQSTIEGRVAEWHVREGASVTRGDTMAVITEIKTEYFDPDLIPRMDRQIAAYREGAENYKGKADALAEQSSTLGQELTVRTSQLKNRLVQDEERLRVAEANLKASNVDLKVAEEQVRRQEEMYRKGVKSLTELEQRQVRFQDAQAKNEALQRQVEVARLELDNSRMALRALEVDIRGKIAKVESDRFGVLSELNKNVAQVEKLANERNNYAVRKSNYVIRAPQDGYINRLYVPGIGENVKEGEPLLEMIPSSRDRAIELYVRPFDMPLMDTGRTVLLVFDGWPNFVFAGWPDQAVGAFRGRIVAVDRNINEQGQYRVLLKPHPDFQPWPAVLPLGSGVRGFILLNQVPLWYELWRQFNGFPPDFYSFKEKDKPK